MTPLQEAWKRVWGTRRTEGPDFESALFALVDAATSEGVEVGKKIATATDSAQGHAVGFGAKRKR